MGGAVIGVGDVDKNGAAVAGDDRVIIVAKFDDHIIHAVFAPQGLVAGRKGPGNQCVIGGMGGLVAPTVVFFQGHEGQAGQRFFDTVGAIKNPPQGKSAKRRYAIAFAGFNRHSARTNGAPDPCRSATGAGP